MYVVYLFLAVFWLLLGAGLLIWQQLHPEAALRFGPGLSANWLGMLAVLLACYNLARWWGGRAAGRRRLEQTAGRPRPERGRDPRPPPATDPTFDFSQPPAPEEDPNRP